MTLRNEVLALTERISELQSHSGLTDELQQSLREWGIDHFCLSVFARPDQQISEVLLAETFPSDWLKWYSEQDYVHHDPGRRHAKRAVIPFEFLRSPFDPELHPKSAQMVTDATEAGLEKGVIVPVTGPLGNRGFMWAGGPRYEVNQSDWPTFYMLAMHAFEQVASIGCTKNAPTNLSQREKEVLSWAAHGKSYWEIGEILNIAERTVEAHTQSAIRKLNAGNRTHAVVLAQRQGQIIL